MLLGGENESDGVLQMPKLSERKAGQFLWNEAGTKALHNGDYLEEPDFDLDNSGVKIM